MMCARLICYDLEQVISCKREYRILRPDKRKWNEIRPLRITRGNMKYAEGEAFIEMGDTKVLCSASVEVGVPNFLKGTGTGWITTEYSMLPRATKTRTIRDSVRGRVGGRSQEIQRIIGRSIRAVVDLNKLGERSIILDCDVVQADGGTRTASINGAFVALTYAIFHLLKQGLISENPINDFMAAVSVGLLNSKPILDLCYEEDSIAEVDMNIVMTGSGEIVEIQGTAEKGPFSKEQLDIMLNLAGKGIKRIITRQKEVISQ
jgi:ribonuclease PH